jgi:hypothetical protein
MFQFLVRFYPSLLLSSNLATSYYSDHRDCPRIIGNEKVVHSQIHAVSNGMWAFAPSAIKHVEYVLLPLGPHNAMGPTGVLTEIDKSNPSNEHLQTNVLSLTQSPQPISPSHFSGDNTHHNIKYLEQLLDSSLATVAVIQFSGNTLADVLTPRAYDTFKALYALAALDAAAASNPLTKPNTFSDIGHDCPFSNNHSPPLPNSSLAVPRNGRIYISIPVDYVILFWWVGLAAVSLVVFFNLPRLFERD